MFFFLLFVLLSRYKGRREFYRYTPKENPAMKTFLVNGINVEVSVSISMCEHWSTLTFVLNTFVMYSKSLLDECIFIFIRFIWLHLYWPHVFFKHRLLLFFYVMVNHMVSVFCVYTRTTHNTKRVVKPFLFGALP